MDVLVVMGSLGVALVLGSGAIWVGGRIAKETMEAQAAATQQVTGAIVTAVREAVHSITAPPPLPPTPDARTMPAAPHMAVYEDDDNAGFPTPDDEYDPTDFTIPPERLMAALGTQDTGVEGFKIDPERYGNG